MKTHEILTDEQLYDAFKLTVFAPRDYRQMIEYKAMLVLCGQKIDPIYYHLLRCVGFIHPDLSVTNLAKEYLSTMAQEINVEYCKK